MAANFLGVLSSVELGSTKVSVRPMKTSGTFKKIFGWLLCDTTYKLDDMRTTNKQIEEFRHRHSDKLNQRNGTIFLHTAQDEPVKEDGSNALITFVVVEGKKTESIVYPFTDETVWNGLYAHYVVTPRKRWKRKT
jgi:hypothetical protein